MGDQQTIEFRGAQFDARARSDLQQIKSDTAADLAAYEAAHQAGDLDCLGVWVGGNRLGTILVSWLDEGPLVFVVNAIFVEPVQGVDMTAQVFAMCDAWARARGAAKLRFWTARKGLQKRTAGLGFRTMYVMERDVHVGR